ncbi:MAG: hypothetical protein ACM3UW_08380 [Bacillota bacterium]
MLSLRFYRIYETGNEIDLDKLEQHLSESHSIARVRFSRVKTKSIIMETRPLMLGLEPTPVQTEWGDLLFSARVKIYDIGTISICLHHEDDTSEPGALEKLALHFAAQRGLNDIFAGYLSWIQEILRPHLNAIAVDPEFYEDYNLYWTSVSDPESDPAAVLMGEKADFSPSIRNEILKNSLSYSSDDFAIVSWDTAWLCDPEDPTDLADLIEYANVQLLQLRFYDTRLSLQMEKMYDHLESADRMSRFQRLRKYHLMMSQLMEVHAEITETTEKIQNLIKITEDVYYARVYAATLNVLRTSQWTESVQRKLDVIHRNYTMLSNEVNIQHSNFLEWMIIILIALEFAWAIWQTFV